MKSRLSKRIAGAKRVRTFNLVEIVLAMGAIAVGLVSIMALFPVGLNASRSAMAESYAAEAADQFLHWMQYKIDTTANGWSEYMVGGGSSEIGTGVPGAADKAFFADSAGNWYDPPNNTILQKTANDQIFKIVRETTGSTGDVRDFEAIMALWRGSVTTPGGTTIGENYAGSLNVEISWPAQLPYTERETATYVLELFNR